MTYYTDGGGWNGEHSRWGIVNENKELVMYAKIFGHSDVTNNIAEYSAVINALIIAQNGDTIISDSQLVVFQLLGKYRCKALNLRPLYEAGMKILSDKNIRLQWKPREENLAGKFLDSGITKNQKVV